MSEYFEHNIDDHEDPLPGPIWIIGFLGAVLLAVIMLGLTALFYNAQQQEEMVKVIQRDPQELEKLRTKQLAQLTAAPRWVQEVPPPPEPGEEPEPSPPPRLVIPIEHAMQIIAQEGGAQTQRQPSQQPNQQGTTATPQSQ